MKRLCFILSLSISLVFGEKAFATRNVSSPLVEKGTLRLESRFGLEFDDRQNVNHRLRQTHFVEYDFNDWYSTRIAGRWSKPESDENDFTFLNWEHRVQVFKEKDYGFDGGFKIVYAMADNSGVADTLDLQFMLQKKVGKWRNRANIIFEHQLGANSEDGLALELSAQSMYTVHKDLQVGIEWFGDLGLIKEQSGINDHAHVMGPVISYALIPSVSLESGYLVGLTDPASDGLLKFFIKAKF